MEIEDQKQSNAQQKKRLNQSASEYIVGSLPNKQLQPGDYFQKFINEVEKEQKISQIMKIKNQRNRQLQKEQYESKKSILPLNFEKSSNGRKKAQISIHLELGKVNKSNPQAFICSKPNKSDVENYLESKYVKLPVMMKKNKKWKIKWREEEKNMGLHKGEEKRKKLFHVGSEETLKYPFKQLDLQPLKLDNKKATSSHNRSSLNDISMSIAVKKELWKVQKSHFR